MEKTIHHGRNVKRFREMLGIKQEAFAIDLEMNGTRRKYLHLSKKKLLMNH